MKNWVEEIAINELPEDLRFIAETCGFDVVKKLLENCKGSSFYLPKNPPRPYVERVIKNLYNGERFIGKRIAKLLSMSEIKFFQIVEEMESKGLKFPIDQKS